MTEVAVPVSDRDGLAATNPLSAPLAALPQTAAVIQLGEWAAELAAAHSIATALASSSFLPMGLRQKSKNVFKNFEELTNDAAAVILAGKSVGLDPMQSVQNIFPVHGMPSMYARTMGALVMAQGHEIRRTAATNDAVTYAVRRKGDTDWQDFTWTIDRAKKAGFTSNAKYQSQPIEMLGAKALAEACRTVFPDILLGMAYSVEDMELEDMGEQPAPPAFKQSATKSDSPAAKAKVSVKRRIAPAPDLPETVTTPAPVEVDAEPMSTDEQHTHLNAALMAAGYKTGPDKSAAINEQIGRETSGPSELTYQEVDDLIGFFNSNTGQAAALDTTPAMTAEDDAAWLAGGK